MAKLNLLVILLLLQNCVFSGCAKQKVLYSKPQIDSSIEWRWHEACGYRCKPMVDFFDGHAISIRIESFNYSQTFTIFSIFICEKSETVTINPEKVYVKLKDGTEISAKGLTPGFSKEDIVTLRKTGMDFQYLLKSARPLTGDLLLDMPYGAEERLYRAISFFFDITPPHPSEEFELHINGLKKNGQKVDVPVIKFGPAIRDSGQGIPIDN